MPWYKQFGFYSNPLDIRPNPLLIGLDNEQKRLQNHILKGEICFINGLTGSGKSSLLKNIQNTLKDHKFIYLDAQDLPDNFNLESELKNKRSFFDKITLKEYPSKKPVLIIDEFQDTDKNLILNARSKWERNHNQKIKAIVIAQISKYLNNVTDSFKERIGNRIITLRTLDDDELKEMLKIRFSQSRKGKLLFNKLNDEALNVLIYASGANPRRFLEYADLIFDFHHQKFGDLNPLKKKDYRVSHHAAKEILEVNDINTVGYSAIREEEMKSSRPGEVFEKYFTIDEQKIIKFLLKNGAATISNIAFATKIKKNKLRALITKLKNKNGLRVSGKDNKMHLWDVTPQAKRMTVKV